MVPGSGETGIHFGGQRFEMPGLAGCHRFSCAQVCELTLCCAKLSPDSGQLQLDLAVGERGHGVGEVGLCIGEVGLGFCELLPQVTNIAHRRGFHPSPPGLG